MFFGQQQAGFTVCPVCRLCYRQPTEGIDESCSRAMPDSVDRGEKGTIAMTRHRFFGKTVFISGASSGIGQAIAEACGERGMQVVVASNDLPGAERVAAGIKNASAVDLDVRHEESWIRALDLAEERHGPLAVMISNAGVAGITLPMHEIAFQDWEWTRSVNLDGAFLGLTHGARRILAAGEGGHIVATSSMSILAPLQRMGTYVATKAAVAAFCEAMRGELADQDIGVSVLAPGPLNTSLIVDNAGRAPSGVRVGGGEGVFAQSLREGRDPAEAGSLVADALGTKRFWLFTHPELEHRIDIRTAEMKAALHRKWSE